VVPRPWCSIQTDPKRHRRFQAAERGAPRELFEEICATASYSVAFASPARSIVTIFCGPRCGAEARGAALPEMPKHVFVDGRDRLDTPCDCDAVIGGDGLVLSIGRPRSSPR